MTCLLYGKLGVLAYWEDRKDIFSDDFQQYMDNEVMPASPISDFKFAGT